MKFFARQTANLLTILSLAAGPVVLTSFSLAPDMAVAKNDKGNGGGNGNGHGKGNGKANSGYGKAKKASAHAAGKPFVYKGNSKAKTSRSSARANTNLAAIGQKIRRDFDGLVNGNKRQKVVAQRPRPVAKPKSHEIKTSLRPVARAPMSGGYRDKSEDRARKRYRDPLVAAITDPDGSTKLRNLNAANAAAPAFANASPNSNVGKIAAYQDAAETYYDLRGELSKQGKEIREFTESYDGRSSLEVEQDISALDPADPDYDAHLAELAQELDAALAYEGEREHMIGDLKAAREEAELAAKQAEDAFYDASMGAVLTRETLAELHGKLGLPIPRY